MGRQEIDARQIPGWRRTILSEEDVPRRRYD
jgi:hypothetical protein